MPIQDTITQAQEEFVESYDTAIDTFIEQSKQVEEEQLDPLTVLGGVIIADYWLQDLLMANAINQYLFRIDSVLDDLILYGSVNELQLQSFRFAHEQLIANYTLSLGEKVKLEVIRGLASGFSATQIKELVERNYFLRTSSVTTFIQTQIADYANLVTQTMSNGMPEDTEYLFVNPLDDKTRHLCIKMVSYGKMTKKEIEASFPGAFLDRGGPNCRGYWEIASNIEDNEQKEAKIRFQGLQDKYKSKNRNLNIKTLQEYYQDRKNG
jgi:hypothetical protein